MKPLLLILIAAGIARAEDKPKVISKEHLLQLELNDKRDEEATAALNKVAEIALKPIRGEAAKIQQDICKEAGIAPPKKCEINRQEGTVVEKKDLPTVPEAKK